MPDHDAEPAISRKQHRVNPTAMRLARSARCAPFIPPCRPDALLSDKSAAPRMRAMSAMFMFSCFAMPLLRAL